jgi:peptidyl-prolyl cis-trans isomerase A (cyclophilin A)
MNSMRLLGGFSLLFLSLVPSFGGTVVRFRTTVGDFDVELFDNDKPVTVQNFLQYVQGGYYTNMFFHRVEPNFVVQGGGYNVVDRGTTNAQLGYVTNFPPITNEFNVGKLYSNVYGTLAMAKTSDPNSATSQFFFNLANNSGSLDKTNNAGGFTVFGHVVAGTNVLNHFLVGSANHLVKELNLGSPLNELPVLYSAVNTNITLDDFIYVDVGSASSYTPVKATYAGLLTVPTNAATAGSGFLTLTTTTGTKFSAKVQLGSARYTFSGAFNANGYAEAIAKAGKRGTVALDLHPDAVLGPEKLVGTISSSDWIAEVEAYRAGFDGRTSLATAYLGKYNLVLPSSGQSNAPAGYGFATMSVNVAGTVMLKGSLADGTTISQSVPLARDGRFPLYGSLYANSGSLAGWMSYTNDPGAELAGALLWSKPAASKGLFPNGFTAPIAAVGGSYKAPTAGVNLFSATNSFVFGGDSSTLSFTNTLILKPGNKLFNTSANKLSLSVAPVSGSFSGSVKPPGSTRSLPFKGALWQNRGYGYFLDAGQSGWVLLQP